MSGMLCARMKSRRRAALGALTAAGVLALAATAWAGRGKPCATCEQCTELLSRPGAEVASSGPLKSGGVCVTIRGEGATFDGSRHSIEAGTAVAVEADDVVVRHLRAAGGERGVHVTGARATLLDARIAEGKVGVLVDGAPDLRIVRSVIERVAIGVAFDEVPSTTCESGARLRSPGAVLQKVSISGTGVAVAACEAMPAIVDSSLTGNQTGWVQGDPTPEASAKGEGPYDPCVCAPTLPDMKPGTTLLYSSGCAGSLFHEGLLPDVRAQGHDINLREYGRGNAAASAVYDAYVRRCAPEITDAIGIPGCMPNYACVASGDVVKRRGDDDRLVVDHRLSTADDVAAFAARCVSMAAAHFGESPCTAPALRGSTLCHNETDVKSARPLAGVDNRCADAKGLGCAPCEGPAPAPMIPVRAAAGGQGSEATDAPEARPRPAAAPTPPEPVKAAPPAGPARAASPETAASESAAAEPDAPQRAPGPAAWWLPLIGLPLGVGIGVFFARR